MACVIDRVQKHIKRQTEYVTSIRITVKFGMVLFQYMYVLFFEWFEPFILDSVFRIVYLFCTVV